MEMPLLMSSLRAVLRSSAPSAVSGVFSHSHNGQMSSASFRCMPYRLNGTRIVGKSQHSHRRRPSYGPTVKSDAAFMELAVLGFRVVESTKPLLRKSRVPHLGFGIHRGVLRALHPR